ncbi:hypothetical protein SDC9_113733 [bioreactor metagenome]|uniref:Uncharacterized protein n=1 Tax=bioreactor metagenome TaxID=1076179 RepID=A0A645BQF6_9ZZZZ
MVVHQGAYVVQAGLLVLPPVARGGVRGEQVPLCRAGAERVGRDDVDAGAEQVTPVMDVLRVARADDHHHHRGDRRAVVGPGAPRGVDHAGVHQPGEVGGDGEAHHVGGGAGDDLAGLVAGGPVRTEHGDLRPLRGGGVRLGEGLEARLGDRERIEVEHLAACRGGRRARSVARPARATGQGGHEHQAGQQQPQWSGPSPGGGTVVGRVTGAASDVAPSAVVALWKDLADWDIAPWGAALWGAALRGAALRGAARWDIAPSDIARWDLAPGGAARWDLVVGRASAASFGTGGVAGARPWGAATLAGSGLRVGHATSGFNISTG